MLAIIGGAIGGTSSESDSKLYMAKLDNYLAELYSRNLIQKNPRTHSFDNLFTQTTSSLYDKGFYEYAEHIYRNYFVNIEDTIDQGFAEIVKKDDVYERQHLLMSGDVLVDADLHESSRDIKYEVKLLNKHLRSRMRLKRSKYEVLELKKYFDESYVSELINAYLETTNKDLESIAQSDFLKQDNIDAYLDLSEKINDLDTDTKKDLISKFFPEINFNDYQSLLNPDEALIIQTAVQIDFSIYFYSLIILKDNYEIIRGDF